MPPLQTAAAICPLDLEVYTPRLDCNNRSEGGSSNGTAGPEGDYPTDPFLATLATASISTSTPFGNPATATVARAGRWSPKCRE